MSIPELELRRVSTMLAALCEKGSPEHLRDKLYLEFVVEGNAITLSEMRTGYGATKSAWLETPVARFRYSPSMGTWALFCMHRDLKWHRYTYLGPRKTFKPLLQEVDEDPTGIFWG
jgi:hypothetical protein